MFRSGAPGGHARRASMRTSLAILALGSMIAIAVAACGSSEAAPGAGMPPPPEVSVATVLSKPVHQWDTFNGRVTAVESVQLRPRVSGYVQRVAFAEGQEVEKGDLLRSAEHTSELQSLMSNSYAVFCSQTTTHQH